MAELLTAAQMRAIEAAAIGSGEVTGLELMERAGRGAVAAILAEWPELAEGERRAAVLCGPGNNGGDGFVVARLLKERGWAVEVFLYGNPEKLPPDAQVNYERWTQANEVVPLDSTNSKRDTWACDLYVDGVFGTGLTRPIGFGARLGEFLPEWDLRDEPERPRVVALDIPTGLCSSSGRSLGFGGLWADLTTTFHRAKPGHFLAEGPFACGRVVVVDIGLDHMRAGAPGATPMRPPFARRPHRYGIGALKLADRPGLWMGKGDPYGRRSHKYDYGHALVLSGGVGRGGAARMAARGALRIGAGLVTLGCPPAALMENASRVDAIMTRAVRGAAGLAAMLEDDRLNALALGPGLGTGEAQAALVRVALGGHADAQDAGADASDGGSGSQVGAAVGAGSAGDPPGAPGPARGLGAGSTMDEPAAGAERRGAGAQGEGPAPARGPEVASGAPAQGGPSPAERGRRPTVLDGDALTLLARDPALFALLHERCVLTPHGGEFARLFPDIARRLDARPEAGPAYSKVDAARAAAARAGCVVLFKGPDTVIAHPDGRAAINSAAYERSAPWLATAGAGDALAGFVAGLLARGLEPMRAAEAAAWLHVECALEFGPGLIAEDLPEQLPKVFRRLGL